MPDAPYVIGIAGASCSGKTLLATRLAGILSHLNPLVFSLDAYYRDLSHLSMEQRELNNFDFPGSLEWPLLIEQLGLLVSGETVRQPVYDYTIHARRPETVELQADGLLIVEGLYALFHREVRRLMSLRIFVDVDDGIAFGRRLERDTRERGSTRQFVIDQYRETVRPMYERYIRPTRKYADLVLDGEESVEELAETVIEDQALKG